MSNASEALTRLENAEAALKSATPSVETAAVLQPWNAELIRFLATSVLAFTFGALVLGALLLWRSNSSGTQILRVLGIITIIGISALLLVVGYSNEQLTPIVGLFGAIAGYLLGKDGTPPSHEPRP